MKSKVLITGASGFIGSFLVEEALCQGYDVYAGIRKTSSLEFLQDKSIHLIELDLSSQPALERKLSAIGFDYVVHNAGITHASRKQDFATVNYTYTRNLTEALRLAGPPPKKFVLISSLAAYGPGNEKTFDAIKVSDSRRPISTYGKSKLMAEQYIQTVSDLNYVVLNPTAVYGPRDRDILEFVKLINRGLEPYIGTNRQMISLVYVEDLARVAVLALSSGVVNRSLLISDGCDYDKVQLGAAIRSALGKKTLKIKVPAAPLRGIIAGVEMMYTLFGRQPFLNLEKVNEISSPNWLCDSEETWKAIDAVPKYSLEQGIRKTALWYKANGWL
jgi:UDP-glucose 4-epimerase